MLTNNITRLLDQRKISYQLHDLKTEEKRSAVEVSILLEVPVDRVYKTILLSPVAGKSKPIAAMVSSADHVDVKKLAAIYHEKKILPMKQAEAENVTGMLSGGISPLGLINKPIRIVVDSSINSHNTVIISAGTRGWQLEMKPVDLITLCKAIIKPISSPDDTSRKENKDET